MDKILIADFLASVKTEYATAILHSLDKLNPDKDAYFNEDELKGVLDFFGQKEITPLLKSGTSASIFQQGNSEQKAKTDVVELSQPSETTTFENGDENDALVTQGSAANEIDCITRADITLSSVGTPYAQQIDALQRLKNLQQKKGADTYSTDAKIEALQSLVEDYLRNHPEEEDKVKRVIKKEITYGQNGNKKAILSQSFGLNGTKASPVSDDNSDTNATSDDNMDDNITYQDLLNSDNNNNNTDGEITYDLDFKTLNSDEQGNTHIRATINAGSDNSDLQAAITYNKKYKNGGLLSFSGNFRETIENKNNTGNYAAAIDYKRNKFSTGAYGMYMHKEVESEAENQKSAEVFGQYGHSVRGAVGLISENGSSYYYTNWRFDGKRQLSNRNLSLTGGIEAEYGILKEDNLLTAPKTFKLNANGGISFASKDLKADVSGTFSSSTTNVDLDSEHNLKASTITASLIGNIETKDVDINATISALKSTLDTNIPEADLSEISDNKVNVITSIRIGIKRLFGEKVMPIFKYNVGNFDGANHNLGVGVVITP